MSRPGTSPVRAHDFQAKRTLAHGHSSSTRLLAGLAVQASPRLNVVLLSRCATSRHRRALSRPQGSPLGTRSSWEAAKPTSLRHIASARYHSHCCCWFAARHGIAVASRTTSGSLSCCTAHHPHALKPGVVTLSNPSREPSAPILELARTPVRAPPQIAARCCCRTHARVRRCVCARQRGTCVPQKTLRVSAGLLRWKPERGIGPACPIRPTRPLFLSMSELWIFVQGEPYGLGLFCPMG
jgi:hypothetical protein